jgi:hypothetical protein
MNKEITEKNKGVLPLLFAFFRGVFQVIQNLRKLLIINKGKMGFTLVLPLRGQGIGVKPFRGLPHYPDRDSIFELPKFYPN